VAAAVIGAGWWALRSAAATPVPTPTAAAPLLTWRAGSAQRYELAVLANVRFGGGATEHAEPVVQDLRGELSFRTLAVGPDAISVGLQLDAITLRVGGVGDPDVARALATPFRVSFARDGRVLGCEFPAGVDAGHAAMLEEVVRTFQVSVQAADAWTSDEGHATGRYLARYVRDDDGSLRRTKQQYVSADTDSRPVVAVDASAATVRLDAGVDWLAGMEVEERLTARDPSGMTFAVHTRASLRLVPAAVAEAAAADAVAWRFASVVPGAAATGRPTSRGDMSAEERAAQLRAMLAELDRVQDGRVVWIHRLRDLLRGDDRVAALLLTELQQGEWSDRTRADVFLALELGGTPGSQAELVRVGGDGTWPHQDRLRALIALGGVQQIDEPVRSALWALARERSSAASGDVANTALLALGAGAASIAVTDPTAAAALREGLLAEAWGASEAGHRATALLALANAGDPASAPGLMPFLDDAAPAVRRAAVKAVVRTGGCDPDDLAARLPGEANSAVRAAIAAGLTASATTSPAALAIARDAVEGEVDERTRLELVRFLGRDVAESATVVTLRRVLASERSDRVRRQIAEILGPLDRSRP
jgi:hypothetical protein